MINVFDDLIKRKSKFNLERQCPYCKSYNINKESTLIGMDDKIKQKVSCGSCNRSYTLVYAEDGRTLLYALCNNGMKIKP